MKILNLYAGIGGNRKLWGEKHKITAVEYDENIAAIYKDLYPNDNVIVADAHDYLLQNFKNYDFIWSSPPCPSHSSFRQNIGVRYRNVKPIYPDMKLYEEIIFLQYNFDKLWVVENVVPYYKPLIQATKLQRHMFWSNFDIEDIKIETDKIRSAQIPELQKLHKVDLSQYKIKDKRKILRNCVHYKLGEHILKQAIC
jgi:DNA (cytosine-5)-methyltransferase 1|tara:strand:- start:1638 stop:2228 length:591 start_codon:yes stop_codon:yes gene_type:complete